MAKILSGKVKKTPPTQVSLDRYNYLELSQAEPDLGVPSVNGYILSSTTEGVRSWVSAGQPVNVDSAVTFQSLTITGTLTHGGLDFASGTAVDQLMTITKTLTLISDWSDTGISGEDLATGTYIVQLYANDTNAGGTNSNEYYTGIMGWYSGSTSSSAELPTDEIVLHRVGAGGEGALYLRTQRSNNNNGPLKLQIYSNTDNASSSNYVFKFRRMI